MMTIKFAKTLTTAAAKTTDTVIIPVTQALKIGGIAKDIDSKSKGVLKRALKVHLTRCTQTATQNALQNYYALSL